MLYFPKYPSIFCQNACWFQRYLSAKVEEYLPLLMTWLVVTDASYPRLQVLGKSESKSMFGCTEAFGNYNRHKLSLALSPGEITVHSEFGYSKAEGLVNHERRNPSQALSLGKVAVQN